MYIDHTTWAKDVKLVLLQNDFPYFTQNNMEHYVLWELNGYITRDDILEKNTSAKKYHTHNRLYLPGGIYHEKTNKKLILKVFDDLSN